MLKIFVILMAVGLSGFPLIAEPLDVTGKWQVSGEIVPSFRVETVIQRDWTAEEKKELTELRSEGYACVFVQRSTYKCRKSFFDQWLPSEDHRLQLLTQFEGKNFEVEKTAGEPVIITEGNSVIQWQLPALIYNSRGKTDSVIYWELGDGVSKLQFEIMGESFWPHFTSVDEMYFRTSILESKGKFQTQFCYDVEFTRK